MNDDNWTAAELRALRDRLGWTQARMAEELGLRSYAQVVHREGKRRHDGKEGFTPLSVLESRHLAALAKRRGITRESLLPSAQLA